MRFTVYIPWDVFWMVPLIWGVFGLVLFLPMWWMSERVILGKEKMTRPGWEPIVRGFLVWPVLFPMLVYQVTLQIQRNRKTGRKER